MVDRKLPLVLLLALAAVTPVQADEVRTIPDFPIKGRPPHFHVERSPVGSFQTPSVKAEPTELQAGDALTFVVRITASGPVLRPPARPRLEDFPDFHEQFEIEDAGAGAGRLDDRTWEFTYRLRPRDTSVKEVPSLPFVFFTPGLLPAHLGYQTRRTEAVELAVKPRLEVKPSAVQGKLPSRAPDSVVQLAEGAAVLYRPAPVALPGPAVLAVLGLIPPALCAGWYALWRRHYPDAGRQARQRRSKAAQQALRALGRIGGTGAADRAEQAAGIMADYLAQRLELPGAEPTPAEVEAHLRRSGVAADLARRSAAFFEACDGARFALPPGADADDLAAAAAQLIHALESSAERGRQETGSAPQLAGLLCLLVAVQPASAAQGDNDLLSAAEAAFREGLRLRDDSPNEARVSFRKAARSYDALRGHGFDGGALARNQGNAWLLGGDMARAIQAYRHGLRLDPGDQALRECLAHAREQVVYSASGDFGHPPVDHRPPWLPPLRRGWLLGLAAGCYSLAWLAFTRWWMTGRGSWLAAGGGTAAICILSAAALAGAEWQDRSEARHPLVVIAEDGVLLYRGNGTAYARYETPLNAGVEARLLFVRGDWLQIELAGGEAGWVAAKYVLVDTP